jgi:hypothetical protein
VIWSRWLLSRHIDESDTNASYIPTGCTGRLDRSLSSFAGVVFGSLNGTFTASVCHTALSSTDGATILADHSGVFTLTNGLTTVGGGFTGGALPRDLHRSLGAFAYRGSRSAAS